jgi:hypothetical protein
MRSAALLFGAGGFDGGIHGRCLEIAGFGSIAQNLCLAPDFTVCQLSVTIVPGLSFMLSLTLGQDLSWSPTGCRRSPSPDFGHVSEGTFLGTSGSQSG